MGGLRLVQRRDPGLAGAAPRRLGQLAALSEPNTRASLRCARIPLAVDCPRSAVDSHIADVAVAAHAHELNLATILWFGPEQTNNNTCEAPPPVFETCDATPKLRDKAWLLEEHPEWLIDASLVDNRCPPTGPPCGTDKLLFDLSLPDAAAWLTDFLRQAISTWGIGEPNALASAEEGRVEAVEREALGRRYVQDREHVRGVRLSDLLGGRRRDAPGGAAPWPAAAGRHPAAPHHRALQAPRRPPRVSTFTHTHTVAAGIWVAFLQEFQR